MKNKRIYKYFKVRGYNTIHKVVKKIKKENEVFFLITISSDKHWDDVICPFKECPHHKFCSKFENKVDCIYFYNIDNFLNNTIKSDKLEYLLKGGKE